MVFGNDLQTLQRQCLLVLHAVVRDAQQISLLTLNDEVVADLPNQLPFFNTIWSHKFLESRNGSSDTGLVVRRKKLEKTLEMLVHTNVRESLFQLLNQ